MGWMWFMNAESGQFYYNGTPNNITMFGARPVITTPKSNLIAE